jgi:hypothetical protein
MQVYPQAVVCLSVTHELGPPRWRGHHPHAIADCPIPLTPSTNPRLGVRSQHKGLHRCALQRLFRAVLSGNVSD